MLTICCRRCHGETTVGMAMARRGFLHCPYCGLRVSISPSDQQPDPAPVQTPDQFFTLDDGAPQALLEESTPRGSPWTRALWGSGIVLLLLTGALQLLWFQRDQLLLAYPELKPLVVTLCDRLHCRVHRQQRLDAMRLLTREVRADVRHPERLSLSAILENTLASHQPWPVLQLVLSDHGGRIVSSGIFLPGDYLGPDSPFTAPGMPPGQPVYFTMTVQGEQSLAPASGFEFHLLPCTRMRSCRRTFTAPSG